MKYAKITAATPALRTMLKYLLLCSVLLALGERITATSDSLPEVNCVAHDTKFTCDCGNRNEAMLLPHLVGFVYQVEISNCRSLTLPANALEETQGLRKLTFRNIGNLVLNKYALAFPKYASNTPLVIAFEQVNFELIASHAINGNVEEISFIGGRIDHIQPFGFSTLKEQAYLLKLQGVRVHRIEAQAFKKFAVQQMEISDCVFEQPLPSKAFYELEVLDALRLQNVQFNYVHMRAFSFKLLAKLSITGNRFDGVDVDWLEAFVRGTVAIRENHFGSTKDSSFKGIAVHRDYESSEALQLHFINNTVQFAAGAPRPLAFNAGFAVNIQHLYYDNALDCAQAIALGERQTAASVYQQAYSDNSYFLCNGSATASGAAASATAAPAARIVHDGQSYASLGRIIADCQQRSDVWLYILVGVCLLLILLSALGIALYMFCARKRRRRKMDVVLPEPRTYKETQIVYQIENAGLLKTDF